MIGEVERISRQYATAAAAAWRRGSAEGRRLSPSYGRTSLSVQLDTLCWPL